MPKKKCVFDEEIDPFLLVHPNMASKMEPFIFHLQTKVSTLFNITIVNAFCFQNKIFDFCKCNGALHTISEVKGGPNSFLQVSRVCCLVLLACNEKYGILSCQTTLPYLLINIFFHLKGLICSDANVGHVPHAINDFDFDKIVFKNVRRK